MLFNLNTVTVLIADKKENNEGLLCIFMSKNMLNEFKKCTCIELKIIHIYIYIAINVHKIFKDYFTGF